MMITAKSAHPILALTTILTMASCSGSVPPTCSDPTVQNIVTQIVRDQLIADALQNFGRGTNYDLVVASYESDLNDAKASLETTYVELEEAKELYEAQPDDDYIASSLDLAKAYVSSAETRRDQLVNTLELMSDISTRADAAIIQLTAFRTQGTDTSIRKSLCSCNIALEFEHLITGELLSNEIGFEYSAQYTDDGSEIYVEGQFL